MNWIVGFYFQIYTYPILSISHSKKLYKHNATNLDKLISFYFLNVLLLGWILKHWYHVCSVVCVPCTCVYYSVYVFVYVCSLHYLP